MADCLDQQIRAPMLEAICLGCAKEAVFRGHRHPAARSAGGFADSAGAM